MKISQGNKKLVFLDLRKNQKESWNWRLRKNKKIFGAIYKEEMGEKYPIEINISNYFNVIKPEWAKYSVVENHAVEQRNQVKN